MLDFLTTITWSNPATIRIIVGIAALITIANYLYWAWSKKEWPFDK